MATSYYWNRKFRKLIAPSLYSKRQLGVKGHTKLAMFNPFVFAQMPLGRYYAYGQYRAFVNNLNSKALPKDFQKYCAGTQKLGIIESGLFQNFLLNLPSNHSFQLPL